MAEILKLKRTPGIAGQLAVDVTVKLESGTYEYGFVGSTYGSPGPVFMIFPGRAQVHVVDPSRFGDTFDSHWVEAFFGKFDPPAKDQP